MYLNALQMRGFAFVAYVQEFVLDFITTFCFLLYNNIVHWREYCSFTNKQKELTKKNCCWLCLHYFLCIFCSLTCIDERQLVMFRCCKSVSY